MLSTPAGSVGNTVRHADARGSRGIDSIDLWRPAVAADVQVSAVRAPLQGLVLRGQERQRPRATFVHRIERVTGDGRGAPDESSVRRRQCIGPDAFGRDRARLGPVIEVLHEDAAGAASLGAPEGDVPPVRQEIGLAQSLELPPRQRSRRTGTSREDGPMCGSRPDTPRARNCRRVTGPPGIPRRAGSRRSRRSCAGRPCRERRRACRRRPRWCRRRTALLASRSRTTPAREEALSGPTQQKPCWRMCVATSMRPSRNTSWMMCISGVGRDQDPDLSCRRHGPQHRRRIPSGRAEPDLPSVRRPRHVSRIASTSSTRSSCPIDRG